MSFSSQEAGCIFSHECFCNGQEGLTLSKLLALDRSWSIPSFKWQCHFQGDPLFAPVMSSSFHRLCSFICVDLPLMVPSSKEWRSKDMYTHLIMARDRSAAHSYTTPNMTLVTTRFQILGHKLSPEVDPLCELAPRKALALQEGVFSVSHIRA